MSTEDVKARHAYDAYDEGDFETAFAMWHELAHKGDALAQNNLSALYDAGEGVPQDSQQAYQWALEAAKNGHQASLGTIGRKLVLGYG
jgi:TPR repeat protein